MAGILYGIGVGPGDPELLTVKAVKAIEGADVIIAPQSKMGADSVAQSIAAPYIKESTTICPMVFPMVPNTQEWEEASKKNYEVIANYLEEGKNVVFLTLGDPMFFSTYMYIFRLMQDSPYTVETIPGIPAFCAIGSQIGYPIVEKEEVLSILPATADKDKLDQALAACDNAVIMKVSRDFAQIKKLLEKNGLLDHAMLVSRCGLPDEEIRMVKDMPEDGKVNYLSTILTKRNK